MRAIAVVVVLILGCHEQMPQCLAVAPHGYCSCADTTRAIRVIAAVYRQAGYEDISRRATVRWHPGLCVVVAGGRETRWDSAGHFCTFGMTVDCTSDIGCAWGHGVVFAHELFHCALDVTTGDPDGQHVLGSWAWAEHSGSLALEQAGLL